MLFCLPKQIRTYCLLEEHIHLVCLFIFHRDHLFLGLLSSFICVFTRLWLFFIFFILTSLPNYVWFYVLFVFCFFVLFLCLFVFPVYTAFSFGVFVPLYFDFSGAQSSPRMVFCLLLLYQPNNWYLDLGNKSVLSVPPSFIHSFIVVKSFLLRIRFILFVRLCLFLNFLSV